jgi:hypothetical protein
MVSIFSVDGVREVKEEYWQLLDIRNFRDKYQQLIKFYKINLSHEKKPRIYIGVQ